MKFFILLFFFILFLACGVKQPIEREIEQAVGRIVVHSEPDGAGIFLDGQSTGKVTPDTLTQIPVGIHTIRTFLPEYQASPDSIVIIVEQNETTVASFNMQKIDYSGAIYVTSAPTGADIFINNQPSGSKTPDTLFLDAGDYTIALHKNGYQSDIQSITVQAETVQFLDVSLPIQKCILLEAFGNVSCTPCLESAHNIDTFVEEQPAGDYAIIEYFANWPSPNDPFYKEAPQDVMQRVMYYQLTSLPAMFIAGSGVDATRYADMDKAFHTASTTWASPLGLSIDKKLVDGRLHVHVELYFIDESATMHNLRLFVGIIENDISFTSPPGSNGLTDFNFVFRGFLSDRNGDAIPLLESHVLTYAAPWSSWNFANSHIIVFVQNSETKQIIHTAIN